jgi:hypothetical protein
MSHELLRYLLIAAVLGSLVYGVHNFPGSHMRSATYVTRPKAWWWSPRRFFNDDEWTAEGLKYRRRFVGWCIVSAALFVALMLVSCAEVTL